MATFSGMSVFSVSIFKTAKSILPPRLSTGTSTFNVYVQVLFKSVVLILALDNEFSEILYI